MNPFKFVEKATEKKTRTIIRFHRPIVYKDILSALINKGSFGYYTYLVILCLKPRIN